MDSPVSKGPAGHLSRNLSAWNNSHNRSPLRYERKHLRLWHATTGSSRPVLMFCRDAKAQSFSARHSGMLIVGSWSLACDEDSQRRRSLAPCQGIQSRVSALDLDIHRYRSGNQTRSHLLDKERSTNHHGSFTG